LTETPPGAPPAPPALPTAPPTGLGLELGRLMPPASIAVVGATDRPGSYAAETLLNLDTIGFP
jgi:acetate---CoA ligase (ADP-forming)